LGLGGNFAPKHTHKKNCNYCERVEEYLSSYDLVEKKETKKG
jgi:hypothetical protein